MTRQLLSTFNKSVLSFLLIITISLGFAQNYDDDTYGEMISPDAIKEWDDIDFMYLSWEEVRYKFVPEELKETTLLFETFTLDQYRDSMEAQISLYFYNKGIDTSVKLNSMDLSGFIDQQLKEVKVFRKKYGSRMNATNAEFVGHYINTDEYRFVLKKHFIIYEVDTATGAINAGEEFFFYDRKLHKAYPIIKADYVWISLNI